MTGPREAASILTWLNPVKDIRWFHGGKKAREIAATWVVVHLLGFCFVPICFLFDFVHYFAQHYD